MKEDNDDMTLRDYFAAKAMQGSITNHQWLTNLFTSVGPEKFIPNIAKAAYEIADAMLKAREES